MFANTLLFSDLLWLAGAHLAKGELYQHTGLFLVSQGPGADGHLSRLMNHARYLSGKPV